MLLLALSVMLSVAACSSVGEQSQSNNAAPANRPAASNNASATPAAATNQPAGNASTAKLNVNTASEEELLKTIPGFGARMAHEFEEYRPYRSIQQFRREIGKYVKPEQVAEYERYIYVPISANDADAATLQQIPGLDATEAEALIAGRPYASRDAFLAKLAEKVSEAEMAAARTYVAQQ
jgi:DNA uptake protein ComE-like DNA-binding protein